MPAVKFLRRTPSHKEGGDDSVFAAELLALDQQLTCFFIYLFVCFLTDLLLQKKQDRRDESLSSCGIKAVFRSFPTCWSPRTAGCTCFAVMVSDVVLLREINSQSEVKARDQFCPGPL